MSTLFDLMTDPDTSPNTIDVLAPSLDATDKLAAKLSKSPLIGQVLTLKSFVPEDQPKKLAMISDTAFLLDATLNPFAVKPQPSDMEIVASLTAAAGGLRQAARVHSKKQPASEKQAAADAEAVPDEDGSASTRPTRTRDAEIAHKPGERLGVMGSLRAATRTPHYVDDLRNIGPLVVGTRAIWPVAAICLLSALVAVRLPALWFVI